MFIENIEFDILIRASLSTAVIQYAKFDVLDFV